MFKLWAFWGKYTPFIEQKYTYAFFRDAFPYRVNMALTAGTQSTAISLSTRLLGLVTNDNEQATC